MFQSQWSTALGICSDMAARAQLNTDAHALKTFAESATPNRLSSFLSPKKILEAGTPSPNVDSVTSRLDDEWLLQSFLVSEVTDTTTSFLPSALPECPCMLSQCFSPEPLCCSRTDDAHRGPTNKHTSVAECERRRARRERNRIAAARCRDRRRMLTDTLQHEAEQLEQEKAHLEEEIAGLEREKEKLELVLEAHKPACKMEESNPE